MAKPLPPRTRRPAARKPSPPAPARPDTAHESRSAEVVLDVDVDDDRVHLVLANCGTAVATDVRVEFSRTLIGLGGSLEVSALPVFSHLGVLRPGRTLRIFWDAAAALLHSREKAGPFTATVSWSERSRPHQRAQYHHDLSIYRQWPVSVDLMPVDDFR
jgi:hypothetical protein